MSIVTTRFFIFFLKCFLYHEISLIQFPQIIKTATQSDFITSLLGSRFIITVMRFRDSVLFYLLLLKIFLQIFFHILQSDRLKLPLHCVLHLLQLIIQDIVDIFSYRTLRVGILVEVKELVVFHTLHRFIYIQKCDF